MKNDQYFPLEANMMNDERLAAVVERFGAKGIGIYLVLLIELRKHEDYRCGLNSVRMLARTYSLGIEVINSVIYDFGLFELKEEGNSILISSPYMDRVMEALEKKRAKCSEAGKKSARKALRGPQGRFTNTAGTEEKSINNNTPAEENNPGIPTGDNLKSWKDNPYRFETIDPTTGERSYYGNIIPADAPPRPSEKMMWNNQSRIWE